MDSLVSIVSGKVVVSSKEIADHFGKVHRDVMRAVKNLSCSDSFRSENFAHSSYKSLQNKELSCYEMTRDGFCFLVMGFDGPRASEWKEAYIRAFNAMESAIRDQNENSVMKKLSDAIDMMEKDKQVASQFGSGLNEWKKIRSGHIEKVNKLMSEAQLLLNF